VRNTVCFNIFCTIRCSLQLFAYREKVKVGLVFLCLNSRFSVHVLPPELRSTFDSLQSTGEITLVIEHGPLNAKDMVLKFHLLLIIQMFTEVRM
jgi:hypothetical protein